MEDVTNQEIYDLLIEIKSILQSRPVSSNAQGDDEAPAKRYQNQKGQWVYQLPSGKAASKCRHCEAEIFWVKSKKGKNVPCNSDGQCHFETCPDKQDQQKPFIPMPSSVKNVGESISDALGGLDSNDRVSF